MSYDFICSFRRLFLFSSIIYHVGVLCSLSLFLSFTLNDPSYDAIESVESRMQEVLSPTPEGEYVGAALVQEVFNIGGTGNIAGSRCTDGIIKKGSNVRIMRGDKILAESRVRTLRSFKSEVDSITEGDECGVGLIDFEDFEPGDVIESYVEAKK